ncbi:hypothetical protein K0504_03435 [Neiella marina]|uniref:Uncharacterized protein n=1 Tax=Neiella holothuriorum TaxID=2870530 RepID=A0ABS7ECL9_9GAMM|nr:hypothetical protein [Neiella holothuriorum]MBW8190077.1 hypothetical protein [Neiella holothuriorum]
MARQLRTRFTAAEALYYLRARPQFSELSDTSLSSAIESFASSSSSDQLTLINLGTIERALAGGNMAFDVDTVSY